MNSYKDLEIYKKAFDLAIRIRNKNLELPNPDNYEVLRRSSQTIKDTIVEGYDRRRYKSDFIKYLVYSHSSLLESHSQTAFSHSIYSKDGWDEISNELDILGAQIHRFIQYVEKDWKTTNI